jgi:hypothetical protein
LGVYASNAQADVQANFTAELGSPLIGQPIDLLLTVEVPEGTSVTLPEFPADWPPFTIQDFSEESTATSSGVTTYQRHLAVTLWQLGDYQTPATMVEYRLPNSSEAQQLVVKPAFFTVKSVLEPDDLNLRPLKPPVSMFYVSPLIVLTVLVGLGVVGGVVWSKRKQLSLPSLVSPTTNLHPSAEAALSEIKRMSSANNVSPKVYALVSDALRGYLQGRFGVQSADMTTQELITDLSRRRDFSERRQRELSSLLDQADLVKFARLQPQSKSTEKLLNVAYGWVLAVENEHQEAEE